MNGVSLNEQLKETEKILEYINQICQETNALNQKIPDIIQLFRQNGLRSETADMLMKKHWTHITHVLDSVLMRMQQQDYKYWENVRDDLKRILSHNE